MRESKKTHKEAIESMKHLLNRFEEERKVMVTVATYRQRCYCELESYLQEGKGTPDIDDRVVGRSSNSLAGRGCDCSLCLSRFVVEESVGIHGSAVSRSVLLFF